MVPPRRLPPGPAYPLMLLLRRSPTASCSAIGVVVMLGAGDGFGVVSRALSGHAYVFSVGPGHQAGRLSWSIASQGAPSRQLGGGTLPAPSQTRLRIEGTCVGGEQQSPVQLALSLDNHVIGRVIDTQDPAPYFGPAGLHVSSAHGGTSVAFSSFQVRAASAP